jgi:hypothetical protein
MFRIASHSHLQFGCRPVISSLQAVKTSQVIPSTATLQLTSLSFYVFQDWLAACNLVGMRGWIILFLLLAMAFLLPFSSAENVASLQGSNLSGLAVFGTLAAVCVVTLIGRKKA